VDQAEAAMWRAGVSPSGPTHHAAYLVVAALAGAATTGSTGTGWSTDPEPSRGFLNPPGTEFFDAGPSSPHGRIRD
jgi:hypothetical protein